MTRASTRASTRANTRANTRKSERPCPMCKQPAPDPRAPEAFPFCSERCRLVDLSRWLDEDYRIPEE